MAVVLVARAALQGTREAASIFKNFSETQGAGLCMAVCLSRCRVEPLTPSPHRLVVVEVLTIARAPSPHERIPTVTLLSWLRRQGVMAWTSLSQMLAGKDLQHCWAGQFTKSCSQVLSPSDGGCTVPVLSTHTTDLRNTAVATTAGRHS